MANPDITASGSEIFAFSARWSGIRPNPARTNPNRLSADRDLFAAIGKTSWLENRKGRSPKTSFTCSKYRRNACKYQAKSQNGNCWLRDDDCCVLVADAAGQPVGYIIGMMRENPPVLLPPTYGLVSDICVDPARRQQGIGRRLFESLQDWFREKGLSTVQLNVAHFSPVSQAFWRAVGCEDFMARLWLGL